MLPRNLHVTQNEYEEYKKSLLAKFDKKMEKSLNQLVIEDNSNDGMFSSNSKFTQKPTKPNKSKKLQPDDNDFEQVPCKGEQYNTILQRTKPDKSLKIHTSKKQKKSNKLSNQNTNPSVSQWAKFKSLEYPNYKQHMAGGVMSYADFTKRASLLWNKANPQDKEELSKSGWKGDWSKISI